MATNPKQTGKMAAKTASGLLRNQKSTALVKKVAASDLSQAPLKKAAKKAPPKGK